MNEKIHDGYAFLSKKGKTTRNHRVFFIFSNVGLQSPFKFFHHTPYRPDIVQKCVIGPFKFFHHTPYRRPILSQSKDTFDGDAEVNLDISFLSSLP